MASPPKTSCFSRPARENMCRSASRAYYVGISSTLMSNAESHSRHTKAKPDYPASAGIPGASTEHSLAYESKCRQCFELKARSNSSTHKNVG